MRPIIRQCLLHKVLADRFEAVNSIFFLFFDLVLGFVLYLLACLKINIVILIIVVVFTPDISAYCMNREIFKFHPHKDESCC